MIKRTGRSWKPADRAAQALQTLVAGAHAGADRMAEGRLRRGARSRSPFLRPRAAGKAKAVQGLETTGVPDLAVRRHLDGRARTPSCRDAQRPGYRDGQPHHAGSSLGRPARRQPWSASCCRISGKDPLMYQRLLVARNRTWMPKLEALMNRPGHAFVVVGAAHLVGSDGLIALLQAKGYRGGADVSGPLHGVSVLVAGAGLAGLRRRARSDDQRRRRDRCRRPQPDRRSRPGRFAIGSPRVSMRKPAAT